MPEGPELHIASRFANTIGSKHTFSGAVIKSEVSTKNPDVPWNEPCYRISSTSRGKEVKLILTADADSESGPKIKPDKAKKKGGKETKTKTMTILFRFGMSGKFRFDEVDNMHKHAHLNFFTTDKKSVLSFVDYRRFGRWEVDSDWGKERGPCVILEYKLFREHVLASLESTAFNKPICEVLLNQKYFNGIGNYLRAEVLHRLKIAPFTRARDVLEPLAQSRDVKQENPDLLQLCHLLPMEVTNLSGGAGYDPEADEKDYSEFSAWLQCYYNPDMKNMVDGNGRTIWYSGPPGPMVPAGKKSRARKTKTNLEKKAPKSDAADTDQVPKAKLTRKTLAEKKPKGKKEGKAVKRKATKDNTAVKDTPRKKMKKEGGGENGPKSTNTRSRRSKRNKTLS